MNQSRSLLSTFLILLFLGCSPVKEYYKFTFKSISNDISKEAAQGNDSIVVLKAVSPVAEDRLISYDKKELNEFAFENDLKVSYLPTETVIEKIVPLSDSLRKDAVLVESQIQIPKISDLRYYGRERVKDSRLVDDEKAFEKSLSAKKRSAIIIFSIIIIGGILFFVGYKNSFGLNFQ